MNNQAFIDELSSRLRDDDAVKPKKQWTTPFLINALNAACGALCMSVPQAFTERANITLVDGTEQEIPEEYHRWIHFDKNIDPQGFLKRSIIKADMSVLDKSEPNWREDESRGYIWHYMPDAIDESKFEVWPPAVAGMEIRGILTRTPRVAETVEAGDEFTIALADKFPFDYSHWLACMEYALYYCFSRDDDQTPNNNRANNHMRNFYQLVNKLEEKEMVVKGTEDASE